MKLTFYLFTLLLFFSCNNNKKAVLSSIENEDIETIDYPYQYNIEDSILVNLKMYEAKSVLHPILDSIINSAKKCESYPKDSMGFLFYIRKIKNERVFTINNTRIKNYNPVFSDAFFLYMNYKFYYKGELIEELFHETKKASLFPGVDMKKDLLLLSDDMGSEWDYIVKKNIELIRFCKCDNTWWVDDRYLRLNDATEEAD